MTMTDSDEMGKLFIGGLSWETTKDNLRTYFSQFGEIVDTVVMKNNETGRSRGFGFITFKDPSCVSIVLSTRPHQLDGRTVDPKECTPRAMQKGRRSDAITKVFLGGLPPDITETEIRRALSKFGKVTDVMIMYDQEKKKSRGFGFLSFESEDSIDQACAEHYVTVNGKQIECKRAEPRDNFRKNSGQSNFGGGRNQNWRSASDSAPQGGYQQQVWNQQGQQQAYGAQESWPAQAPPSGNAYGNYQNYGAPPPAANYSSYNSAPAAQYSQPGYQNYGAAPTYDYSQTAGQAAPAPTQSYGAPQGSYDAASYSQGSAGYGAAANYGSGGYAAKSQGYGNSEGSTGYSAQGDTQSSRGQGYHPYRR